MSIYYIAPYKFSSSAVRYTAIIRRTKAATET